MCGFAGVFVPGGGLIEEHLLHEMGNALKHRGPDDAGIWLDCDVGIGLSHRRLAIMDTSPAGHQPMRSITGRFTIVFNGEIYNHLDLRKELAAERKAPVWQGHSDTETLLAAIEVWGVEKTLQCIVGMFAFALWDHSEKELWLGRDRMGEKPLYCGWQNGVFLFGSELKALKVHPEFVGEIDRNVLTLLLRHNYIPAPHSIYKNIRKLLPGTYLRLGSDGGESIEPQAYWKLHDVVTQGKSSLFSGNDDEAVDGLNDLLLGSVKQQMIADVPLGAFLSGGIDSSTVAALMQVQSSQPIKTFTIGFDVKGYNEAEHAKLVAAHLGTEHTELYVSPDDAMNVISRLPSLYDEPFSDASQIPTFLVSQMTQQHVTVSLSGDAGDELFGGYNRYFWVQKLWKKLRLLPAPAWGVVSRLITSIPPHRLNSMLGYIFNLLPRNTDVPLLGDKMHKLAGIIDSGSPEVIYHRLVSEWKAPENIVIGSSEPHTLLTQPDKWPELSEIEHRMMYLDGMTYLPDDILTKVDRAAMGVSLETRVPFLDHRVVEFAWQLPLHMKVRNNEGKWALRQVLYKYLPRELMERPKMGFGVPIGTWLRGPLKTWAEELLDEQRIRQQGWFHYEPIRKKWNEHLSGQRNWQYSLWSILMFQAWLEEQEG